MHLNCTLQIHLGSKINSMLIYLTRSFILVHLRFTCAHMHILADHAARAYVIFFYLL